MVRTAIAFLLGCVVISQLPSLPSTAVWLGLAVLFVSSLCRGYWRIAVVIFALFFTGLEASQRLNDRLNEVNTQVDLLLIGTIDSIPQQQADRLRFEFKPDDTATTLPSKIRLNWYFPPAITPAAGEKWQLQVRLKPPHGMANPNTFDYERGLFQQSIGATGYVRDNDQNGKLATAPWYVLNHWRQLIAGKIQTLLANSPNLPLMQGLTVGLRDAMQPHQWSILRNTGTSHLLAISGLHIGLAAGLGFFVGRWLGSIGSHQLLKLPATVSGAIGGLVMAWFYALLAGMSIPSQRALIMISLMMLALLLRRSAFNYQVLAGSLLCVLLIDPFAVLSAGFWLSFAAVVIILYVSQNRHPAAKWMWLKIHLWIAFALSPLLLLFFSQTSLIAPLANIIAVPVVSLLVVPLLLLSVALLAVNDSWASYPLQLADWILSQLWTILTYLAALPSATWQVAALPWPLILLSLIGLALLLAPRGWPAKKLGVFMLCPALFFSPSRPEQGVVWFSLLDVGQGLASVIQTHRHTLVFDTGPKFGDFDTGDAVVVPYLQSRGVKKIDMLLISHGDNDHLGGAQSVLNALPVQRIMSNSNTVLPGAHTCVAGQKWQWDQVEFELLHPRSDTRGSSNDVSCVLKITSAGGKILLTGDIERGGEFALLRHQRNKLDADILVVAHHGSKSSSTESFIDAVAPHYALFSTGYLNRWQFPAKEVVERFDARQIKMFNTADDGALLLNLKPDQPIKITRWRKHRKRLWTTGATD